MLEFIPETVNKVARHYAKSKQTIPMFYIKVMFHFIVSHKMNIKFIHFYFKHEKLFMYQLFRSLAYIHSTGICHRDIKPQNLLLDPESAILKLCDFGRLFIGFLFFFLILIVIIKCLKQLKVQNN